MILIFEFIGTMLFTLLFNSLCGYLANDVMGSLHDFNGPLLLGYWVLLIFSYKISGSHFNPAITLAFMFRKDAGRFSRPLGILYIVF